MTEGGLRAPRRVLAAAARCPEAFVDRREATKLPDTHLKTDAESREKRLHVSCHVGVAFHGRGKTRRARGSTSGKGDKSWCRHVIVHAERRRLQAPGGRRAR